MVEFKLDTWIHKPCCIGPLSDWSMKGWHPLNRCLWNCRGSLANNLHLKYHAEIARRQVVPPNGLMQLSPQMRGSLRLTLTTCSLFAMYETVDRYQNYICGWCWQEVIVKIRRWQCMAVICQVLGSTARLWAPMVTANCHKLCLCNARGLCARLVE